MQIQENYCISSYYGACNIVHFTVSDVGKRQLKFPIILRLNGIDYGIWSCDQPVPGIWTFDNNFHVPK